MAHSCAHLRNWFLWWNVSEASLREMYIQSGCCQPPQPWWRPPGYKTASSTRPSLARSGLVVKRNDSICALFEFDVFVMHYTIRLIWQFPLYLIKYLCRPEDGSSYQRGLICSPDGALVCSKKAISQLKLGTFVGKYSLYLLKICNVKKGSLYIKICKISKCRYQ